jgi:hypothetical protein
MDIRALNTITFYKKVLIKKRKRSDFAIGTIG